MKYEKGLYIDTYRVSLPLKEKGATETYRVRDASGLLLVVKTGATEAEHAAAPLSPLFEADRGEYVVYRHINGETLETRLARLSSLDYDEALSLTCELLEQLGAFHEKGLAHSNLSADNVMIELGGDAPHAHIVGLSSVRPVAEYPVSQDLEAVARLIYFMLNGESPDRVKVRLGNLSRLEAVMMKAFDAGFSSGAEMLATLRGEGIVSLSPKPQPGEGFAKVVGMEELKQRLKDEVIDILAKKEEAARYGINIPNGMLLYGPPGCGKSFLAERFAEEAGYNYRYVKSSDLASTYLHGSQEKIAQLFDEARTDAPTIICFDEFDALVPRRDDINNASHGAEVNEFLTQLNNCGRHGVFVIATTNRPDRIDSAVLRAGRIDYMIYVPAPDEEAREKLFELAVAQRPHNPGINYKKLARKTTGFMAVDISAVVEQAARIAFRTKTEITQELLGEVLKERKPSMTKSMIAEYDRIREAFDSRECDAPRRQIGFLGF